MQARSCMKHGPCLGAHARVASVTEEHDPLPPPAANPRGPREFAVAPENNEPNKTILSPAGDNTDETTAELNQGHALGVARKPHDAAPSIRVVHPPALEREADASDHREAGGAAEPVEELAAKPPERADEAPAREQPEDERPDRAPEADRWGEPVDFLAD